MASSKSSLEQLNELKIFKLKEQERLADKFHQRMTGPNGLNEASRMTCKNLEAAVVASKRPGYFTYYEPPDELKECVRTNELKTLTLQISSIQKELDQLETEIEAAKKASLKEPVMPEVGSLSQWFSIYGTPRPTASGYLTTFDGGSKVYGASNHHAAFKTQATIMKRGHLTR